MLRVKVQQFCHPFTGSSEPVAFCLWYRSRAHLIHAVPTRMRQECPEIRVGKNVVLWQPWHNLHSIEKGQVI